MLIAIRADFYGHCAAYPELWRLLGANQAPVGPMGRDELRSAIERPAHEAGLAVEPDLTHALIDDATIPFHGRRAEVRCSLRSRP